MNKIMSLFSLVFILCFQNVSAQNAHQNISVNIDVTQSSIAVDNMIDLPCGLLDNEYSTFLYLNKILTIDNVKGGKITEVENSDEESKSYVSKYKLNNNYIYLKQIF